MGNANVYSGHILYPYQSVMFRVADGIKTAITQRAIEQQIAEGRYRDINDVINALRSTEGDETPGELNPFLDRVIVIDYWPDKGAYYIGEGTVIFRNVILNIQGWKVMS